MLGFFRGLVLGPASFLLHINHLHTICSGLKYVDYTTVWETCCEDLNNSQLQVTADQACEWPKRNQMTTYTPNPVVELLPHRYCVGANLTAP